MTDDREIALTDRGFLLIAIDHLAQGKRHADPVMQALHRELAIGVLLDLDDRLKVRTQ